MSEFFCLQGNELNEACDDATERVWYTLNETTIFNR